MTETEAPYNAGAAEGFVRHTNKEKMEIYFDMQDMIRPVEIMVDGSRLQIARHAIREAAWDYVNSLNVSFEWLHSQEATDNLYGYWLVTAAMKTGALGSGIFMQSRQISDNVINGLHKGESAATGVAKAYYERAIANKIRGRLMNTPEFKEWFSKELMQW